jgi:hypothetical protein
MPVFTDRNNAPHLFHIERLNETTFKKRKSYNRAFPSGNTLHLSIYNISENFDFPAKSP